jgi:hypothetical protein
MNPSVPLSPHAQPSHGIELFSLHVYPAGARAFCHTALRSAGAFEKSKIQEWPLDGVSDLVQVSSLVSSCGVQAATGRQSKGVTRVRPSGMLIPTAGLLHLRQVSMDVAVSLSCAHAAATAARRACAGRVLGVHADCCELTDALCRVCVCTTPVYVCLPRSPGRRRGG